jgi:hypothetical protein
MPVTTDIVRSYSAPGGVMRRHLAAGLREDRAMAFLMGACAIIFIAQWPRLQREATLNPDAPPLDAQLGGALLGWIFIAPLLAYGLAALSHMIVRLLGGSRGSWYSARLALFWTMMATSPLFLLQGLVAGFIGPGPAMTVSGLALLLAFFVIWGACLRESHWRASA